MGTSVQDGCWGVYPNAATGTSTAPHEHALFDHPIRLQQHRRRDRKA